MQQLHANVNRLTLFFRSTTLPANPISYHKEGPMNLPTKNNRDRTKFGAATLLLFFATTLSGQTVPAPVRGSLAGTVTSDQGSVVGFRVTAHNLTYKLWYTVFTVKGHYTIPQALPGAYDVSVLEKGYASPTLRIALKPAENKSANITVKKITAGTAAQGLATEAMTSALGGPPAGVNTVWVNNLDELYPPGPGRDLLKANCTGCHGTEFGTMHRTKAGYRTGIARMMETGPTDDAFATNLGNTYL